MLRRPLHIAITGSHGFIGEHLTAALLERGDIVRRIHRPFEAAALARVFEEAEVVVHLAGIVSSSRKRDFYAANVDATRVVAGAVRAAGARLIHVSSLAAAGPARVLRTEDDPASPITPYGWSKLKGEDVVRGLVGLRWTILRPGAVYGPGDRAMKPLFRLAEHGILPLMGRPASAFMFIYITDLVCALIAAIDVGASGETIFLAHRRPVTALDLLEAIRDAMGCRAAIVPVPLALARVAANVGDVSGWLTGRSAFLNRWRYAELASEGFMCSVDRMRHLLSVEAQIDPREGMAYLCQSQKICN